MTTRDELPGPPDRRRSGHRDPVSRYLFAFTAALAGLLVVAALMEVEATKDPVYAPMIAAVAVTAWYGGLGAAVLAVVVAWFGALFLVVDDAGDVTLGLTHDATRWSINLGVAVIVAGVGGLLRVRELTSRGEAHSAQEAMEEIAALQQLSAALATAATSADVVSVVSTEAAGAASARGAALGLVEGDELVVFDASDADGGKGNGRRVRLDASSLLAAAVRDGSAAFVADRAELAASYPDGLGLPSEGVESALAVPVLAGGEVVGVVGFAFASAAPAEEDVQGLAHIVADLAGQALERASLYEAEQERAAALERILLVAPRFAAEATADLSQTICREARGTFNGDFGVLWRVDGDDIELLAMDPPIHEQETIRLPLADFPRLRQAVAGLGSSFMPDVLASSYGAGNEFVRRFGIRSSLRTPIVISGRSELVLVISWKIVVSAPDAATMVLVRRFADQAGLALEQLERRRAEDAARAREDATRRLQAVTVALSMAATPFDVSTTCLEHALASVGAEAGFVALTGPPSSRRVELLASSGYEDDELEAWQALDLDSDVPFARAIGSGEPIWALATDEMSAFSGLVEPQSSGWLAIPLMTRDGARGALHLSFRSPRVLDDEERQWLVTMVSQCGQALERSGLYDQERRSRLRAERLQAITALLSNALTPADVAGVVADEVLVAVEPTALAVAAIREGEVSDVLAARGEAGGTLASVLERSPNPDSSGGRVLRARKSLVVDAVELPRLFPDLADDLVATGFGTLFVVPLVAGRRPNGLLVAAWNDEKRLEEDERAIVEALAGQAALALDRARQFEFEQTIAETLQRSVLPVSLPRVEGVQMAARYLPGSTQLDVGGDWFDALQLPDGRLGLVVGDVVGKGVQAAASMGQLRNAIRAYSVERLKPPSALARLDRLADEVLDMSFATLVYLVVDLEQGVLRFSSAGHPPPLLRTPDGKSVFLEGARGLPLGTGLDPKYRQETVELPAGSVLLLYTDGLVERRGRSIDEGLAELETAVRSAPTDPDRLLECVLDALVHGERGDDIAMLAARFLPVAPRPLDLRVRAHLDSMDLVRDAMRAWLEGVDLERVEAENVVLATWEACANAIEHALDPVGETVAVSGRILDASVEVSIADTGRWAPPSGKENRGLGLPLIESLSTRSLISTSETGTTVTIEKALSPPRPD